MREADWRHPDQDDILERLNASGHPIIDQLHELRSTPDLADHQPRAH